MKKIICVLAVVCLVFTFTLSNLAFAANGPAFTVSSASVKAGKTAEIKISIKNNPGICSAKLAVEFDSDLTLNAVTYGSAFSKAQAPELLSSPVVLNWFGGLSDIKANGDFATLKFAVSKTAANGKHNIKISYDANDVFNVNEDNINFAIENGTVTVSGGKTASSSASSKNSNDSSAKSSSSAKDASQNSSATTSAEISSGDANGTPVTDAKSGDEGDGDALLGEILFDENGNEIDSENKEESTETVGASTEEASSKTPLLIAVISAAVLLVGAGALVVLRKKAPKK